MCRIPEKQFRKLNGFKLGQTLFLSVCKSPTQSLTFHWTEICWLFLPLFDLLRFILYSFVQAEFFHATLRFQKEKNFEETLCLQPRQFVSILLHLHLYASYCSSAGFRWRQKCWFWIPRCLLFWAPFLFWLSRFYRLSFRLFIPTF